MQGRKLSAVPDEFYKTIQKRVEKKSDDCKAVILAELEKSQLRITEIDKYIQGLFEAKVIGTDCTPLAKGVHDCIKS